MIYLLLKRCYSCGHSTEGQKLWLSKALEKSITMTSVSAPNCILVTRSCVNWISCVLHDTRDRKPC